MKKIILTAVTVFIIIAIILTAFLFLYKKKEIVIPETAVNVPREKTIKVPAICQYPTLPTGCESVAATMVLQYYGINITAEEFAANWLECNQNFYTSGNELYGPDPNSVFQETRSVKTPTVALPHQ